MKAMDKSLWFPAPLLICHRLCWAVSRVPASSIIDAMNDDPNEKKLLLVMMAVKLELD